MYVTFTNQGAVWSENFMYGSEGEVLPTKGVSILSRLKFKKQR